MTIPSYRKYSNKKVVTASGIKYDSKREAKRGAELELMEKAGLISGLERQVVYELVPKQEGERAVTYRADFVYWEHSESGIAFRIVVEDSKGFRTPEYVIKRKLLKYVHGITITEV